MKNTEKSTTFSLVQWPEFLTIHPEVSRSIPGATRFSDKKEVVDLEQGPLSLVRISEELHE
jgi:hypothetical protein